MTVPLKSVRDHDGQTVYSFFSKQSCPVIPFDIRGCRLEIGDEVVYAVEQKVTTREDVVGEKTIIEIVNPRLKRSEIGCIQIVYGTGFSEVGNDVTIILADGHRETGDSENGGWTMLRLHDRVKR